MTKLHGLFLVTAVLLMSQLGFGSTPKTSQTPAESKPTGLIRDINLQSYLQNLAPDQVVEKMDSSGKTSPDIFVVFQKLESGGRQLRMQLFDLNRDGRIDLVKHFSGGKLVKTEMDLDYDGKVDVVSEYDPKSGELIKKIQADGSTNIWKHYFHNELRKKEVDRNQDGKPDMWVYYRNGKILRTEIDQNFDGKVIRVEGPLSNPKAKKKGV